MDPEIIIPIGVLFVLVGIPVICGTLIKLARIIKGDSGGGSKQSNKSSVSESDEIELMNSIHRSLNRLEKRIDAIETIVIEKETNKKQ